MNNKTDNALGSVEPRANEQKRKYSKRDFIFEIRFSFTDATLSRVKKRLGKTVDRRFDEKIPGLCLKVSDNDRQIANREVLLIDKEKHLANLTRIQNEACQKGQYGVAGKMEELKGKVQGFYIDRNMTLTKEVSDTDLNDRLKDMFQTRKEFEAMNKAMAEDLFGDPKKVKKEE